MPRTTKKNLLLGVMAIALLAGGTMALQFTPAGQAIAQGAGGDMPAMPVPAITIAQKPVQIWKEFSGRMVAVDYVEVRPQVSGIIQKINFEDGQIVEAGDVLFNIDPRPYEAAVASARADLAEAQQDSTYTQKELDRAEQLLKTGAISQAGYDARVNSQKNNKSAISGANARLKAAMVDLDHAAIKAPIDGRISRPEITEGNLVTAAAAPLLTSIVSDKAIYADFEVDEQTYLGFVRTQGGSGLESEQAIPVKLSLNNDTHIYEGKIKSFDNKISSTSGTIRARAIFENEDGALLPGMFARVRIGSAASADLITVPEKAVMTDQSRKFVYVVSDGAATYREVKLGDTVSNERVVLSGLQPGDQVIIDNLMKIRPGAKVQAMSPEELNAMKAQMAGQAQAGAATPAAEAETAPPAQEETPAETSIPDAVDGEAPDSEPTEETPAQE